MKEVNYQFPYLPGRLEGLGVLAYNLWFSWHSRAIQLFKCLDPKLWHDVTHNPVLLLRQIDPQRLDEASKDKSYLQQYDTVMEAFYNFMDTKETWFQKNYPEQSMNPVAYFSMEFGLHECLPLYSGGLGILAGDHIKSASDLGIPLVGMGLLYRESYFTQYISLHGQQESFYLHNDFSALAIQPVRNGSGELLTVKVKMDHRTIFARVWKVSIGRNPLYLLDTDFPENPESDRIITERLYVGDREFRLLQEMLIGIGGAIALREMGIQPAVWHLNEGHCSFALIERLRQELVNGASMKDAIEKIRKTSIFTTHTPVPAGNEVFETSLIEKFMDGYWNNTGMTKEDFFSLAQSKNKRDTNTFNMTILALNLTKKANGVSKLHGQVARRMWQYLWPELPVEKVPIQSITNGVHARTWIAHPVKSMFDEFLGESWRYELNNGKFWKDIDQIPDEALWNVHNELKEILIKEVRSRSKAQRERNGESRESIAETANLLDTKALTIGFARRFALYKRSILLFRNREWLKHLLVQSDRPVQIIFAGKAHPEDQTGKSLIHQIYSESRNPEFRGKIVFVENYDMAFARKLIAGVDLWLNTPRRPHEASGTSGMKAAMNGVLNLSIMDGWWPEAYDTTNGWMIGHEIDYYNEMEQDESDSYSLYSLLEKEIIPLYYKVNEKNKPEEWIKMMKSSMKSIIYPFNTNRMLDQYVKLMYLPRKRK